MSSSFGFGGGGGGDDDAQVDPRAQAEMQQFLQQEQQRLEVQQVVNKLTERCWEMCVTGKPGTSLSSWESDCVSKCVNRFLDASKFITQRMYQKQA